MAKDSSLHHARGRGLWSALMLRLRLSVLVVVVFLGIGAPTDASSSDVDLRIVAPGKKVIYQKIIVIGDAAQLFHGEDEPIGKGKPVPFATFYKLKATKDGKEYLAKGKDYYIRVGAFDGRPVGWLKVGKLPPKDGDFEPGPIECDFIHWEGRFVLTPEKANIFQGLAPILQNEGNDTITIFRVGSVASASKPAVASGPVQARLKDMKLEVVFVIDTTAGMSSGLDMMNQVIKQCDKALAGIPELKGAIRFGVVEFRDYSASDYKTPAGKFAARVASPLTGDLKALSTTIGKLEAEGGGDTPDDVLAGLHLAVTGGKDGKAVGWSENSSKHIILVGDASAHLEKGPGNSTNMTIDGIIKLAKLTDGTKLAQALDSKCFHAVHILNPFDPVDSKLCAEQFKEIAKNGSAGGGKYIDVDPNKIEDRKRAIDELADFLKKGITGLSALRTLDEKNLESSAKFNRFGIDFDTTPKVMGYGARHDSKGQLRVMVTYGELNRLKSALDVVIPRLKLKAGPAVRKDVGDLVRLLQTAAAEAASGQRLRSDQDVRELIADLAHRPGVLSISVDDVAKMDAETYQRWLAKLDESKKRAEELIQKGEWIDVIDYSNLNSKAETKERYLFLLEAEMP